MPTFTRGEEASKPCAPMDVGTRKGPMTGGWAAGSESGSGVLALAFRMQAEWQYNLWQIGLCFFRTPHSPARMTLTLISFKEFQAYALHYMHFNLFVFQVTDDKS